MKKRFTRDFLTKLIKNEWQSKRLLNRLTLASAILAICVSCAGVAKIAKSKLDNPKQAKISLNYQTASEGQNPNGTRFDPYEIISDEVLELASKKLGYTIDSSHIWISLPESGSGSSISTDYYLYCDSSNGVEVLKAVLEAWSDKFNSTHTVSQSSLEYDEPTDNTDYIFLENWLENESNDLLSYAKTRLKDNNKWTNDDNEGFQSIYDEIENFVNNDVAKYKTYIIDNGVTKDADELKRTIAYKDKLLLNKKSNYDEQYSNRLKAINLYDPTLFPTISVPSVSSGTYYITTTKTGLDYIYDAASTASTNATDIQTTLNDDSQLLANMSESNTDKVADKMYKKLVEKLNKLSNKLKKIDDEYESTQEEPYFSLLVDGVSYQPGGETSE